MTSHTNEKSGTAGFTLLEMIVVIAVMGLLLAMVADYGQPRSHWLETRAAAQRVAEAMQHTRGKAIETGQPVAVALPHFPAWLNVTVQTHRRGIVFEPDGSAIGGYVMLDENGRKIIVTADWLTGRVSVADH